MSGIIEEQFKELISSINSSYLGDRARSRAMSAIGFLQGIITAFALMHSETKILKEYLESKENGGQTII